MKKTSANACQPLSILVLDDNEQWRRIVRSTLESDLGVAPFVAKDGYEAIDILNANPIDVVVSDLNMPVMNGIQFLKEARSLSPGTKVIIMSVDVSMSEELVARGAFAVVSKVDITPNLIDLLRTIKASRCRATPASMD